MILYYGVTTYQFFCFMVHKLAYKKDKEAVLMLPARINDSEKLEKNIRNTGIFADVVLYKEFFPKSKIVNEEVIRKAIEESIEMVDSYQIDFKSFDEIYVASDHYSVGVYLNSKKIKYNFFEEGNGRLSTSEDVLEHLQKINPIRAEIAKKLELFGFSDNVIKRYGNTSFNRNDGYYDVRDEDFNVSEILKSLTENEVAKIFSSFGVTKESIQELLSPNQKKQLLLTQHYINMGLLTYESQILLYKNLLDYFGDCDSKLFVKPHPSDIHVNYQKEFPGAMVLPFAFPAELLTVLDVHFTKGIAASSTSINSFRNIVDEIICLDQRIESDVLNFNKYYICSEILKKIETKELELVGVNDLLLKQFFLNQQTAVTSKDGIKVCIIDNPENDGFGVIQRIIQSNRDPRSVIIFLDTKNKSYFINNHNLKQNYKILPIEIGVKSSLDEIKEYIYLYSENVELFQEIISEMKVTKQLRYSGITITVDMQDETQVKIYEGINRSLENRLSDVTNAYKKLVKKESEKAHAAEPSNHLPIESKAFRKNESSYKIIVERFFVRLCTLFNKKKYKKYLKDRNQYFKDGWLYQIFNK